MYRLLAGKLCLFFLPVFIETIDCVEKTCIEHWIYVQGGRKVPGHSIFNILMLYFFFSDSILYYFRSGVAEKSQDTPKIVQNKIRKKKYSIKILKIECPGTFRPFSVMAEFQQIITEPSQFIKFKSSVFFITFPVIFQSLI